MKKRKCCTRIFAVLAVITVLMGSLMLPIGAEEATETTVAETPSYTSPIDWLSYPGANLIPYPYSFSNDTASGITATVNNDGSVTYNGTATNQTNPYYTNSLLLPKGTYTLSGAPKGSSWTTQIMIVQTNDYSTILAEDYGNGKTFTLDKDTMVRICLIIAKGATCSNLTVYPMLNAGDVAYPYQPYLPYYFQQAYDEGYNTGKTEGYNEGEKNAYETIETLQKSIFDTATYQSTTKFNVSSTAKLTLDNFIINKTQDGVYFKNLKQLIIAKLTDEYCAQYMEETKITLTWDDENAWNWETYGFSIYGVNLVRSATLTTTENKIYTLDAGDYSYNTRNFTICETEIKYPIYVKSITIHVNESYDYLDSFTIISNSKEYNHGYTAGYIKGSTDNNNNQYKTGYEIGKKDGILLGKKEGLELAKKGDWTNLFSAVVEAPINTFQSLFNFEILGLDMRAAFGSMLAICVLLIILKKIIL